MNCYKPYARTTFTFAERCGVPTEYDAAMGRIALSFAYMEETARQVILFLSGMQPQVGQVLTAELSFRLKLEAIGALGHLCLARLPTETQREESRQDMFELLRLCQQAEDLRNTYLHSTYAIDGTRTKLTARRKHGLKAVVEPTDAGLLLDVADFILETASELDSLPLVLGIADEMCGDCRGIVYRLAGAVAFTRTIGQ